MTKYTVILKVTKPDDSDAGDLYLYHVETEDDPHRWSIEVDQAEELAWKEYCQAHDVSIDEVDEYEHRALFTFFGHQEDI